MYSDFHFYIDLNWEDAVDKTVEIYLREFCRLVEFAYQHEATIYYSQKHLQKFISQVEDLDVNFSVSVGNILDVMIENAKRQDNEFYSFELCFANENTTILHIDNILSFVKDHDKIAILTCSNKIEDFLLVKSKSNYGKIECKNINTSQKLVHWIATVKPRTFNLSPKHGEKGKGNYSKASPLLCSKEEAQNMLDDAIPCFLEQEKSLFNFDTIHQTFIVFYFEGDNPQNQWHGFHLKQEEWENVPDFIRKYFNRY